MKTSYFAKYRGTKGVSVALKAPKGFVGSELVGLAPTWAMLRQYKKDGDEQAYKEAYYKHVLSNFSPHHVYDVLSDKTLLCWEKSDTFCHRRLIADWIEKHTGHKVLEDHT